MHASNQASKNKLIGLLTLALLVIGALVFWPGLHGWFVFDDHVNLVTSERWKVASLEWKEWRRALSSDISGAVGRPLAIGTFALNYYFTGLDAFWMKATNLALHLLNGLLVWCLCRRLFQLLPENQSLGVKVAWLVAAAWVVHPLHVSTVMYIVQRMEVGAATGILLALLAYMSGRSRQMTGRTSWPWLAAALLAMMLGLGFKETALLTPGFALLIEFTILRFRCQDSGVSQRWKVAWGVMMITALATYLYIILPQITHWPYEIRDFGPGERLLTQLPIMVMYTQQILLPLPESLRFYYDNYPISHGLLEPRWTTVSIFILLAMAGTALTAFRRASLVTLGIGWFFVGHFLTSNLWPLELAFEHRNYLPSLGLLIALVQPVQWLLRHVSADAKAPILSLPILLFATLCNLQARTWGDPTQLAWTLENRNPDSPRASYDLASQLLAAANDNPDSPFWSMALRQFERGALDPEPSPLALQGLLLMYGRARIEPPERYWELLRKALTAKGLRAEGSAALHALTACQIQNRCSFNLARMKDIFVSVVQRNPENATAHTLYANFAWNVLRDRGLAIELQRTAVSLDASSMEYCFSLAKFLLASGDRENRAEGRALLERLRERNDLGALDKELAELESIAAGPILQTPTRSDWPAVDNHVGGSRISTGIHID